MRSKKVSKNWFQRVPKWTPKVGKKSTERVFWRGSKEEPKKGTLSRSRKSEILLLFTTL